MLLALSGIAFLTAACGSKSHIVSAGAQVDMSNDLGWEAEVTIAADPNRPNVLLAASNAGDLAGLLVYTSDDGGKTWEYDAPPLPSAKDVCGGGDPAVAIGAHGEQAVGYIVERPCGEPGTAIAVAHRTSRSGEWRIGKRPVSTPPAGGADDKPSLAYGPNGLYASWTRYRPGAIDAVVARSPNGGLTWRPPEVVGFGGGAIDTSIGTGRRGGVFSAWGSSVDGDLLASRAEPGTRFSPPREFAKAPSPPEGARCAREEGGTSIPAQPVRCVTASPHVAVDRSSGRVYVVYENGDDDGVQVVNLAAFTRELKLLDGFPRRVHPGDGKMPSDQFLPAIAVDESDGTVWLCYYDTRGDPTRRKTWFTCTASLDGGESFLKPVHAASAPSDETQRPADVDFGYGEYAGVAASHGIAHPVWTDSRELDSLGEEIYTTRLKIEN